MPTWLSWRLPACRRIATLANMTTDDEDEDDDEDDDKEVERDDYDYDHEYGNDADEGDEG